MTVARAEAWQGEVATVGQEDGVVDWWEKEARRVAGRTEHVSLMGDPGHMIQAMATAMVDEGVIVPTVVDDKQVRAKDRVTLELVTPHMQVEEPKLETEKQKGQWMRAVENTENAVRGLMMGRVLKEAARAMGRDEIYNTEVGRIQTVQELEGFYQAALESLPVSAGKMQILQQGGVINERSGKGGGTKIGDIAPVARIVSEKVWQIPSEEMEAVETREKGKQRQKNMLLLGSGILSVVGGGMIIEAEYGVLDDVKQMLGVGRQEEVEESGCLVEFKNGCGLAINMNGEVAVIDDEGNVVGEWTEVSPENSAIMTADGGEVRVLYHLLGGKVFDVPMGWSYKFGGEVVRNGDLIPFNEELPRFDNDVQVVMDVDGKFALVKDTGERLTEWQMISPERNVIEVQGGEIRILYHSTEGKITGVPIGWAYRQMNSKGEYIVLQNGDLVVTSEVE